MNPDPSPAAPVDTSAEAVARMVDGLRGANEPASTLLAAVVKERDEARAERDRARGERDELEQARGDWTGEKCATCGGCGMVAGEMVDVACNACGGTGDEWLTWRERADTASRQLAEARAALLDRIRQENGCHTPPPQRCDGWDAEKCGCAIEARALLSGETQI